MLVHHCTICEASLALSAGVCVLGMRSHTDDTLYQMLCFNNEMLGVGPSGTLIKERQKSKRNLNFLKSNSSGCRRSNNYIVYNKLLSNLQCYLWSDEYQKFKKKTKKNENMSREWRQSGCKESHDL